MVGGEKISLLPVVRWAQRKENISLRVELQECKHPDISLEPESIRFSVDAVGAKGRNHYSFSLNFYKKVDVESVVHTLTGSSIQIYLAKKVPGEWWPQLTTRAKNPHFLKLDFDKWISESDEEEDGRKMMRDNFMPDIQDGRKKHEAKVETLKKGYLIVYNVIQFLAHLYIFLFCFVNIYRGGAQVLPYTYDHVGKAVHLTVMLSLMETVHPLTGVIKGSWITPLMQSGGRNFALFCLWLASDYIKSEWYVTALFVAWSSIELVRYPLYVCQIVNISSKALTWVRYTIWIPLYPIGVLMEAILFIRASHAFTENGVYELQMPNEYNISLKFTWLIKIYIAVLFYCIATIMIPHMWKMRKSKLGRKKYKQP